MNLFHVVKKYVDEYDFDYLLDAHAPRDEYDHESLEISRMIDDNSAASEIAEAFSKVFSRSMGKLSKVDVNDSGSFLEIAKKIKVEIDSASKGLVETYFLNEKTLPTIPVPHDCVVKRLYAENQYLIFEFEDAISIHDSIKAIKPEARSLIIKYHLTDEDDFSIYKRVKPRKLFWREGGYQGLSNQKLSTLTDSNLEYLSHHVAPGSIITTLYAKGHLILESCVDYIEYDWIF